MKAFPVVRVALLCGLVAVGCGWAAEPVTAVLAGAVVDPESGTARTKQTILIPGGTIQAVGAGIAVPPGAQV
jgi:hypothetical protein